MLWEGPPLRIRKAVIPAAGLGTRFLPASKAQPKEMLPVVDTPIIQLVVEEAVHAGIEDILIITGRGKRAIEDHFDRSVELEQFLSRAEKPGLLGTLRRISDLADIHFIRQKEPLGLGHAILQARRHVGNEPFAVLLGDEVFDADPPAIGQMMNLVDGCEGALVAVRQVAREEIERYGSIKPGPAACGVFRVLDLVEKPKPDAAPSLWAIVGRYLLGPAIFDVLADLPPGRNGEIQLTDALRVLCGSIPVFACELKGRRYDVGDKLGYLQANVEFALRRPEIGAAFAAYLAGLLEPSAGGLRQVAITADSPRQ